MVEIALLSEESARQQGFVPLEEAAKITGGDRTSYFRQVKTGKKSGCQVRKGTRNTYWILLSCVQQDSDRSTQVKISYQEMHDAWIGDMLSGVFGNKPVSKGYAKLCTQVLNRYWKILNLKPDISGISAENLKIVYRHKDYAVDEENQIDHFSVKTSIYRACISFTDYLIEKGLKSFTDREALTKLKPKKRFKLQNRMLSKDEIQEMFRFNEVWRKGRTSYDIVVLDLLISFYAFAGLRASEAVKLKIEHVAFKERFLHVKGKGGKDRFVNIHPELLPKLKNWLEKNRPNSNSDYFLVQKNGNKFTLAMICSRFLRLSNACKNHVHAHALRRSFANIMSNDNMPLELIQNSLGHSDIRMTMRYTNSSFKHTQAWWNKRFYDKEVPDKEEDRPEKVSITDILDEFING